MQIAGSQCATCGRTVGVVRDGKACTSCRAVYHKDCLTSSNCPSCGQPLLGGQDAHALPSAFEQTERERPTSVTIVGRLTYLGVPLGVITALAGVVQIPGDLAAGIETIVVGLLTAVLCAAVGSGFMRGKEWARRFYLWVTPLGLAVELLAGENGVLQSGFSWWRFAVGLAAYCAFALVLTRPKASAFFRREARANAARAD